MVEIEAQDPRQPAYRTYAISDLRHLTYEDVGTKSNVGALALLGVLGLGARKSWTLITLGLDSGDAQFLCRAPLHEIRRQMQSVLRTCPSLPSKLHEGPRVVSPEISSGHEQDGRDSPTNELERLASLYERGLVSEDEFQSLKQAIVERAVNPHRFD